MELKYFPAMTYEELREAMRNLLNDYEYDNDCPYDPSDHALDKIIVEWHENKSPILEWMSRHPNYNGKGQIVLTEEYNRNYDKETVYSFLQRIDLQLVDVPNTVTLMAPTDGVPSCFVPSMREFVGQTTEITFREEFSSLFHVAADRSHWWWDACCFEETHEQAERIVKAKQFFNNNDFIMQYADEDLTERFNAAFPWLSVHEGQKVSKVFRRIFKELGVDKEPWFNAEWPKFADALNPLKVTRYTIISVNPLDYYTMSFGNDWQSCHTIDKTQKRHHRGQDYSGCFSSGTESYMLDGTSIVVYIVDRSYDGNEFELQPKLSRQMFHIGEDKIVQGRLYPQDNDSGAEETYRQIREIVQRVYTECNDVPNGWIIKKGTEACGNVINSHGTHYPDYWHFDNCNVSYLKNEKGEAKNTNHIHIGHLPICPQCGCEHGEEEYLVCEDCRDGGYTCDNCGCHIYRDNDERVEVDGYVFCDYDCAENYGYVYCENINEWCHRENCDVFYNDCREAWCYGDWVASEDGFTCFEDEMEGAGFIWNEEDGEYVRREDD